MDAHHAALRIDRRSDWASGVRSAAFREDHRIDVVPHNATYEGKGETHVRRVTFDRYDGDYVGWLRAKFADSRMRLYQRIGAGIENDCGCG